MKSNYFRFNGKRLIEGVETSHEFLNESKASVYIPHKLVAGAIMVLDYRERMIILIPINA